TNPTAAHSRSANELVPSPPHRATIPAAELPHRAEQERLGQPRKAECFSHRLAGCAPESRATPGADSAAARRDPHSADCAVRPPLWKSLCLTTTVRPG